MKNANSLRSKFKQGLSKRYMESHDNRDNTGKFQLYLLSNIPLRFWKPGEGQHYIDILPWIIGDNFPDKTYPDAKPGDPAYVLDIWAHPNIGADEDMELCMFRNYVGGQCPICEYLAFLKKNVDPKHPLIDQYKARRRVVYQVWVSDSPAEEAKGVQLFEVSHYFMEKHLAQRAAKPRGGGFIPFADPDDGRTVYFTKTGSKLNTEYSAHDFIEREFEITDDLLKSCIKLDDYLRFMEYEELFEKFHGVPYVEGVSLWDLVHNVSTKEQQPTRGTRRRDSGPSVQEDQHEEPKQETQQEEGPARGRTRRTRSTANDEPKQTRRTKTGNTTGTGPKRRARGTQDEDTQKTGGENTAGRRKTAGKAEPKKEETAAQECPGGGVFGESIDELAFCNQCNKWDECAEAADSMQFDGPNDDPDDGVPF